MKNKNKIIAIIVAVVLVASIFVVGTVANTKNTSIAISIDKTELSAGQSATVTVTASADYPVATASIPVFYDKTMVTVSNATATLTGYAVAEVTTDLTAVNSAKIYANTNMNSEKFGFVLVTYIGGANDTVSTLENTAVLTFKITAKSDVSGEALVKCVTESAKTDDNVEGMLYFGATTSGTTITSIPENVENVNLANATQSATIVTGNADLMVKDNMPTVIDATNKYIYGITPGDSVEDYIKVNNGSFELVANSSGYTNGKMPSVSQYSLFQRIRIRSDLKHIHIMVCFQKKSIHTPKTLHCVFIKRPKICNHAEPLSPVCKSIRHRLCRIMGNPHGIYCQIFDYQRFICPYSLKQFLIYSAKTSAIHNRFQRPCGTVYRYVILS